MNVKEFENTFFFSFFFPFFSLGYKLRWLIWGWKSSLAEKYYVLLFTSKLVCPSPLFVVLSPYCAIFSCYSHDPPTVLSSLLGWRTTQIHFNPVGWGCRIHWLHLWSWGKTPPPTHPTSVLDTILNNLMAKLQLWSFREVPLHCHYSQVHSNPEWKHLAGFYLWVK